MVKLLYLLPLLAGCSLGVNGTADQVDASIHDPPDGLCCRIQVNTTSDPYWDNQIYGCNLDAGVVFSGNLNYVPWICNSDETCLNPDCVIGSKCLGFNGSGEVIECPDGF